MYANCLRHLPDAGITIAELRHRARTGTNLDGMRRWRYVTLTPDPGHGSHLPGGHSAFPGAPPRTSRPVPPEGLPDGRARAYRTGRPQPDALIRPTAWGIEARDTWQAVTAEVESRWRDRLGAGAVHALRAALAGIVERLDPALPDCLPILGYGLLTRPRPRRQDHNRAPRRDAARSRRPAGPGTRRRPAALGAAFAAAARVRGAVRGRAGPVARDQRQRPARPDRGGRAHERHPCPWRRLQGGGGDGHRRHARSSAWLTEGPDPAGSRFKVTRLTARGAAARDEYPALAADIERDWRARFGDARVTALRQALEPLAAGDPPRLSPASRRTRTTGVPGCRRPRRSRITR